MKTIAAISTATAPGGIGIIRISGDMAREVGDRVFRALSGEKLIDAAGYTCRFGHVFDTDGNRLDECIATVFAAPKSFTGEDVIELSCHGGLYILKTVLKAVFAAGAFPAEAGEFTRRAFMNGKMDLAQAEAVMQLISAQGREAMKAAQAGHDGALSRRIGAIRDDLTDIGAHLSAWADYPDDDIPQVDENMLKERLSAGRDALQKLLNSFDGGRILREGVVTVIAGKPNAGKSTLMNLLAGCERSIVTELAGTTRDVIEETVLLGDIPLRLADTAGIRETEDRVEQIGVRIALDRVKTAQFVLAVFDASESLNEDDRAMMDAIGNTPCVAVVNKSDLEAKIDMSELRDRFTHIVTISAISGDGLTALSDAAAKALNTAQLNPNDGILYTERQRADVQNALSCMEEAQGALLLGMTWDAVTVSLEGVIAALNELTGERVSDAVVDKVFSKFCVGK
ncbi:MAG: tRNA uridine-5-carboxymethylaminomethyl(34) synthesis GTPase MnmE [Clostridia bacterium]|nr:tRNA uridine-5-carboxymethylaminomethyl(34) synthesis GTPase MnmE [Clostridia bacterium]